VKFKSSAEIDASSETVWEAVKDPEEWPQWVSSIKKVEIISEGPLGVGEQVRVIAKAGITINLLMTITQFVPKQHLIMEGKILGSRLIRSYTIEPLDNKTRFTAGGEVFGPTAWLIRRGGQRLSNEIVQSLKVKVEG